MTQIRSHAEVGEIVKIIVDETEKDNKLNVIRQAISLRGFKDFMRLVYRQIIFINADDTMITPNGNPTEDNRGRSYRLISLWKHYEMFSKLVDNNVNIKRRFRQVIGDMQSYEAELLMRAVKNEPIIGLTDVITLEDMNSIDPVSFVISSPPPVSTESSVPPVKSTNGVVVDEAPSEEKIENVVEDHIEEKAVESKPQIQSKKKGRGRPRKN